MDGMNMEEKVFKDPVHDYIYVKDRLIWDLINSKVMQRLRYIKQLGTSYLTFHGAEHSRFAHSLGTYETMRQVISHFKRNYNWTPEERTERLAYTAALLHDVGHGPFSHTFERCFDCHHEVWTSRIILQEPEIFHILSQVDEQFPFDVVRVLKKESEHPILHQLITSQLDVDRMDYLLRDANATGVIYGKYELERLIRIMRPQDDQVVVKKSGLHTVEQYLLARYFMYSQVYLHPVTIGADVLIEKVLKRAEWCFNQGILSFMPEELQYIFAHEPENMPIELYINLDDSMLLYTFHKWTKERDSILSDLTHRFLHRRLLKSIPYGQDQLSESQKEQIKEIFQSVGTEAEYYLDFRPVTMDGYLYRQGIIICDEHSQCQDLAGMSKMIQSLETKTENRLYYPKDRLQQVFNQGNTSERTNMVSIMDIFSKI